MRRGGARATAGTGQKAASASTSSQEEHDAAGRVAVKVPLGQLTHSLETAVVFQGQRVQEAAADEDMEPGGQAKQTCGARMMMMMTTMMMMMMMTRRSRRRTRKVMMKMGSSSGFIGKAHVTYIRHMHMPHRAGYLSAESSVGTGEARR